MEATRIIDGPADPGPYLDALAIGTTFQNGQFAITGHLSSGGFGITYLATDTTLDRKVVIKECFPEAYGRRVGSEVHPKSANQAEQYQTTVNMFMREARAIAALRHPGIVGVHRVFEENNTAYMALDLIDGQELIDHIDRLTPADVQSLLYKVLVAVDVIHTADLLHRDISPDNILIDRHGDPVLIDFGAARDKASTKTRAVSNLLVVKDGFSPAEFYISGGRQTPASDLYALAATFYFVITGKPPVDSQTRMAEVAEGKPDPCPTLEGRFPDYPATFLRSIDTAMKILARDRIASVTDWLDCLGTARPATQPRQPKAALDPALTKSLSKWVEETNAQVRQSQAKEPEPKPAVAPATKPTSATTPIWVEEFNEQTQELRSRAQLMDDAAKGDDIALALLEEMDDEDEELDVPADAAPDKSECDWIARAVAKQHAVRAAEEAQLAGHIMPPLAVLNDAGEAKPLPRPVDINTTKAMTQLPVGLTAEAERPTSKSLATGLVLILSALALNLG